MATSRAKMIYSPKEGDEVKWPNGLVMIATPDGIITVIPGDESDLLAVTEGVGEPVHFDGPVWTLGVE